MLNKFIYTFILNKIKYAFAVAIAIGLIILLFLGQNVLFQYAYGFIVSCINFSLMSLEADYLLGPRRGKASLIHIVLFMFRYGIVAYVIAEFIQNKSANPFIVILGLLTLNISMVVWASAGHFITKKEG